MRNFFNSDTGLIVKINAERFVIIGDDSLISDDDLSALYDVATAGRINLPEGWTETL